MAKVTNAFTTYGAKGNREQLAPDIFNVDPTATPFVSEIAKSRRPVKSRQFDWQTEALPAVNTTAEVEGFELARSAATPTARIFNVTQINKRDATVTDSQEAADAAGKNSEMAHQMAIASKALKIDMEVVLTGKQPRVDGDDGTARNTRALEHWITTNVSYGATGANGANATTALTDGTVREFTRVLLDDRLQAAFTNGAQCDTLMVGPSMKRKLSTFTGRAGSEVQVAKDEIVASVSIYRSDFGNLKAVPNIRQRDRTVFGLVSDMLKIAYYRAPMWKDIAPIGDAETKLLRCEYGLQVNNEKGLFKIADLDIADLD